VHDPCTHCLIVDHLMEVDAFLALDDDNVSPPASPVSPPASNDLKALCS
jgi:hypothetical protein